MILLIIKSILSTLNSVLISLRYFLPLRSPPFENNNFSKIFCMLRFSIKGIVIVDGIISKITIIYNNEYLFSKSKFGFPFTGNNLTSVRDGEIS